MNNPETLNPPAPGQVNDTFYLTEDIPFEDKLKSCQKIRGWHYPDIKNYLDGIVKNDQTQIDAYIAECLAVKTRFPKPQ